MLNNLKHAEPKAEALLARTERAAMIAAAHADTVDAQARFPEEAVAALKAENLLGVLVPTSVGGEDVHVSDVVDGMLRLAVSPIAEGRVIDIGTGTLISTADLVTMICRLTRPEISPAIGAIPDRPMEPTGAANVEETRRLIDWKASVRLEEGVRQTIEWFRMNMDFTKA